MKTRTGKPQATPPPKQAVRVPHDTINEQVLLAAYVVDEQARKLLRGIPSGSFYGAGHADLWDTLQELDRRGLHYDPATVRSLGGPNVKVQYLEALIRERPAAPPNLRHHIGTLAWDRSRIEMSGGPLVELLEALQDARSSPEHLRGLVKRMHDALGGQGSQLHLRSGVDVAREQARILTARREQGMKFWPFGIEGVDVYEDGHEHAGRPRLLPGTAPGNITVVTGRSGSGKSTMMASAVGGMMDAGRKVLWGCWEQGSGVSLEILAAIRCGFSRRDLVEGNFTKEEQRQLVEEMERIGANIKFYEFHYQGRSAREANDRVLDQVYQVVSDSGCDVFVADLFRRVLHESDPDAEEFALYRLQAMGQQLRVHIIPVQQQKTKGESVRRDMRPSGENIKGSSAWFEVADAILAPHRPGQWKQIPDDTLEVLVLKQRHGPWPLAVELAWDGEYGTIGYGRSIPFPHDRDDQLSFNEGIDDVTSVFVEKGKSKRR